MPIALLGLVTVAGAFAGKLIYDSRRVYHLTIATAGQGGEYYAFSQTLAEVVTRHHPHIQIRLLETSGSRENMQLLESGQVELAIAQTGESGSAEAKEIMTQLALHLSSDINTLEQAVAALVAGYLNKRSDVLKNAMGALNTLRNAQTSSFCSGLTPDFLAKQKAAKNQLMEIANIFN